MQYICDASQLSHTTRDVSVVLFADSFHLLYQAVDLYVLMFSVVLSSRRSDECYTFGYPFFSMPPFLFLSLLSALSFTISCERSSDSKCLESSLISLFCSLCGLRLSRKSSCECGCQRLSERYSLSLYVSIYLFLCLSLSLSLSLSL